MEADVACTHRGCSSRKTRLVQSATRIRSGKNVREDVRECPAGHRFVVATDEGGFVIGTMNMPGPIIGKGP